VGARRNTIENKATIGARRRGERAADDRDGRVVDGNGGGGGIRACNDAAGDDACGGILGGEEAGQK
jgi:hypothetical protein